MIRRLRWLLRCTVAIVVFAPAVRAEAPSTVDIDAAMALALVHHPIAEEDAASVRAATASIDVQRAQYWPNLQVFGELDRSTANPGVGALFSVPALPVVAGTPGRSLSSSFVTAVGATASWDALGYQRWNAMIDEAHLEVRAARADAAARDLELEYEAADHFIAVVAADEAVKAARSGVDRAQVFLPIVKAVVDSGLRPGADLARAQAELSVATTALIHAEAGAQVARAQLAKAVGMPDASFAIAPGALLVLPPVVATPPGSPRDPRIVAEDAKIDAASAQRHVIETGTLPKLDLVGALWARAHAPDDTGIAADGLVPDVPNIAVGVVVTWPVFAGKTVGPQARVQDALIARDRAHEREVRLDIDADLAQARAILDGAYRAAQNTPIALKAARDAEQQATAHYRAQLATADDVAQAQHLLEQAEIDDAVARLEVWRAILFGAYASGDLTSFTKLYHQVGG